MSFFEAILAWLFTDKIVQVGLRDASASKKLERPGMIINIVNSLCL